MPNLTKEHAERIRDKLGTQPADPQKHRLQIDVRTKGPHDVVVIRYRNVMVGRFGIQRGQNRNAGHNYIPQQIHLSKQQGTAFAVCDLSIDQYIDILLQDDDVQQRVNEQSR